MADLLIDDLTAAVQLSVEPRNRFGHLCRGEKGLLFTVQKLAERRPIDVERRLQLLQVPA